MDPVTDTFVGAALSQSGLGRRTPLAPAALVLGANLPDVDVLSYSNPEDDRWPPGAGSSCPKASRTAITARALASPAAGLTGAAPAAGSVALVALDW
jgi:hypothetical protein